jgi:hypothetical protein
MTTAHRGVRHAHVRSGGRERQGSEQVLSKKIDANADELARQINDAEANN